jgi:hypothetical protein
MVPVLTIRAQAQQSDIAIGRIQVDLGTNTQLYNKIFSKIYAVDVATGQVLASSLLNSSTVAQSGSFYLVTLSGFSDVVKAGTYKDIAIKADLYSSVDSAYLSGGIHVVTNTFTIDASGVRGTDGAGIDQYGPLNAIYQTVIVNPSLVDNANATVSLAASTPLTNTIAVTDTTYGQYLQLPVLAFTVNANGDTLHLHNLSVLFTGTPSIGATNTATATAAYLYNGSTMVASASIASPSGIATFSNISDGTAGASIPAGTSVTFTVKADVTGVTAGSYNLTAAYTDTGTTYGNTDIYNSTDGTVTATPTLVTGNLQSILGKGPAFTLVGAPTITKSLVSGTNTSTSTVLATFNLQIQSLGADTLLGLQASTTPTFTFGIYQNGIRTPLQVSSSSAETVPSSGVTFSTGSYTISQGGIINLPVTFTFLGNTSTGTPLSLGSYAVGIEKMSWYTGGVSASTTFSAGQTAWRTPAVSLPN